MTTVASTDPEPRQRPVRSRWRAGLAALLISVGAILAPLAMIGYWATTTILDTDSFVAAFTPLIAEPDVQQYLSEQTLTALESRVDIDELVARVFAGTDQATAQLPITSAALAVLKDSIADGFRSVVGQAADRVIASPGFATTWENVLRISHRQLTGALSGDPAVAATVTSDGFGLQLGPIVDQIRTSLTEQGYRLAELIPAVDHTIVLIPGTELTRWQAGYQVGVALAGWLPWVCLALLAGGILLAGDRRAALVRAGFALAAGFAVVALAVVVTGGILPGQFDSIPESVIAVGFTAATGPLSDLALTGLTISILIALPAWLGTTGPIARRLRSGGNTALRQFHRWRDGIGLTTGRFGRFLAAHRRALGWVIGLLVVGHLWFTRPLSPGGIITGAAAGGVLLTLTRLLEAEVPTEPPADDNGV